MDDDPTFVEATAMSPINDSFRKYTSNRDILHDLMPLRMREILLVAPPYDAFSLEHDAPLSEVIYDEYNQLNLANAPRITSVSSEEAAVQRMQGRRFDLVIVLSRVHRVDWRSLTTRLRAIDPQIPILLLLNDNAEIGFFDQNHHLLAGFDNVFVWNGNSEIFLAMVKLVEDRFNVANDTRIGLVRVILLVEDSIRYYSRYLPVLYREIVKQTYRLIVEEHLDEMRKILRLRARPKVLMASTFEEAMAIYERYRDYLLCVISDVAYPRGGAIDELAGVELIRQVRRQSPNLPVLLQSSNPGNARLAEEIGAGFIDKNSESLADDLASFFYHKLGFGHFIFRDNTGRELARATTLPELKECLSRIPAESVLYHASRDHFSAWLMARGEIAIAQVVFDAKVDDFSSAEDLRRFLVDVGEHVMRRNVTGQVVPFDEAYLGDAWDRSIIRLAKGSLGGKGRGISFVNALLADLQLDQQFPGVEIRIPRTAVIGVDEFAAFLHDNKLYKLVLECQDYDAVKRRFLMGNLTPDLVLRLQRYLDRARYPLAIRSSGMLEDSQSHPLAGLYQTFFLPNNDPDPAIRLQQVMEAIKLVYASVYSPAARAYFEAIGFKIEEERMAIVLQEVVGDRHGSRFYPHISGVAQSYNFYPVGYLEPGDGVAQIALGLGRYVVGGEPSFRFCPAYPDVDLTPPSQQAKFAQTHFYALALDRRHPDLFAGDGATLATLPVEAAAADGTLDHLVSTWDYREERLRIGMSGVEGVRVLNFAPILKLQAFPLAPILQAMLGHIKTAMDTPVEIEFAVDLGPRERRPPTFHLLQIKHLGLDERDCGIDLAAVGGEDLFLLTDKCLGNGVDLTLQDIVWVDPERFDRARMPEMAAEVAELNEKLKREGRKYLLLGPGRWGTRDRWLGIPVGWAQISQARAIVEFEIEGFAVEASQGSHFFHNITSMNIGYFTVPLRSPPCRLDWEWLRAQPVMQRTAHLVHTRTPHSLPLVMDGRRRLAALFKKPRTF
ncbi:MAG: Phosphoenolpyruvate synthase / Pyruvate phosphate dikinase [Candidatus Ozemobacter sibiricus]|uniref:Phosphoenolpyruvate synthase / Pyruvate phosphate dikinase n=1 Tax=Candidatus Ozemobacter sibiricus TaxID=2268124 RepID=A0A367ZRH7_9BACT|nr:MAG: Phosphoenolpyruvate synthase / Pyruvate phosphate dikinase [Candidatus Ozemobacter sibiricus]